MSSEDDSVTIISQIFVFPYRRAEDGSRGFQEHHQGLSKLVFSLHSNDMSGVPTYYLTATRNEDQQRLVHFAFTHDFRTRYTTNEHFLMFLNRTTNDMYGFGTCKDESSVEKTAEFHKELTNVISILQKNYTQLQRQQSKVQSSLQATSSTATNQQNIDAIHALLPMSIIETVEQADDDLTSSSSSSLTVNPSTTTTSTIATTTTSPFTNQPTTPRLGKTASSSSLASPLQQKTHLPIIMPSNPTPATSADKSDRILNSNLRRHRNSITHDPASIPPELKFVEKPDLQLTGKDQDYDSTVAKLGNLETFPIRKEAITTADEHSDPTVSKPYHVEHKTHISFGRDGFHGIPQEWIIELNRQFGISLEQLPASTVSGYSAKIPFVLQTLRDLLIDKGGFETIGIFRLAPMAEHSNKAKDDIDNGLLLTKAAMRDSSGKLIFDYEVHVISNLIKVWLRDLPTKLLNHVHRGRVEECKTAQEAWEIIALLPDPYLSVAQYLIDFLSVVASHHDINKMPPTNLAICFCPNLINVNSNDPMASLVFTQKLSKFFTLAIQYRIDHPRDDMDEQVDSLAMLFSTESAEILPHVPSRHIANP